MKKILKWAGMVVAVFALLVGVFLISMRFADGPVEIFSGGAFTSGELTAAPADWTFLTDRNTIEFQTMDPTTSRTVWVAVHEQRLFLLSGYMDTGYGGIWKKWPHYLENDDRVILRIDGKLYEQRLERIMQGSEIVPVLSEISRKYLGNAAVTSDEQVTSSSAWMYEVVDQ